MKTYFWTWSVLVCFLALPAVAEDWPQFRGILQDGVATTANLPTTWSNSQNLLWQAKLPGPGSSSPVVVGGKIYLTSYSGYGEDENNPGDQSALQRQVLCFDLKTGKEEWTFAAKALVPEESFQGFQALHGYASSTPACDSDALYVFFGKSGVGCLGLNGKPRWGCKVGDKTHSWGSGTSPVLYKNTVIVNASVESGALVGINKKTGSIAWTQRGVRAAWNSPILVKAPNNKVELVLSSEGELQGYDPENGKPLWRAPGIQDYVCPSVIAHDGIIYAIGARSGMGVAVKAGGRGDVPVLWEMKRGSNVCSPVFHEGHLYWTHESRGVAYCADAKTGEVLYEQRLEPRPDLIYASGLLAGDKIYYVSRNNGVYVVAAKPQFELVAHNRSLDSSVFNASPVAVDGKLLLRSNEALYCVGLK
ncbi:outer membrane biogenesis protein BamB [Anatilimnocola aggregata]|uniref:Outer membrane biogenesis protein BamB n=1 Tax=Anatilimnocola aggregata TaxID=2528021 RepID=A0A517YB24_9BACT|nr:PQQ-binding-like beta-propeller repeat protein [Anatilimnocola aggregata]QDU27445.1 outer membrane biogenesis protein BamB [Anatilimnocola aggregata]